MHSELNDKRVKGLCYHCNENHMLGHQCKKCQIYLLEEEQEAKKQKTNEIKDQQFDSNEDLEMPLIFVHALSGSLSCQTMQVKGFIKKRLITILIYSDNYYQKLKNHNVIMWVLKGNLKKAQHRVKQQVNIHGSKRSFEVKGFSVSKV